MRSTFVVLVGALLSVTAIAVCTVQLHQERDETTGDRPGLPDREAPPDHQSRSDVATSPARVLVTEPAQFPDTVARGSVVDLIDGRESPAVGVVVQVSNENSPGRLEETRTDDLGQFVLSLKALMDTSDGPAALQIRASGNNRLHEAVENVRLRRPGDSVHDIKLRRRDTAPLEGIVLDDTSGPLAGVRLTFDCKREEKLIQAVSDPEGRFRLEGPPDLSGDLDASLKGYILLRRSPLTVKDGGGWHPLRLVMTRAATLAVRVVSEQQPLVGTGLGVRIHQGRTNGSKWEQGERDDGNYVSAAMLLAGTNVHGVATFPTVWADYELDVLVPAGEVHLFQAQYNGTLTKTRGAGAEPVLLAPGEYRELVVQLGQRVLLVGRTTTLDGSSIPSAQVQVSRLSPKGLPQRYSRTHSDNQGRFDCVISGLEPGDRVQVVATGRSSFDNKQLAGIAVADPVGLRDGELRVEVIMAPTAALGGRVLGPDDEPIQGIVAVRPERVLGPEDPRQILASLPVPLADGRFRIEGLAEGLYEVLVRESVPGGQLRHRFPNCLAGNEGLVLRVDSAADVSIRVRISAEGADTSRCIAVIEHLGPLEDAWGSPGRSRRLDGLSRWPREVPLGTTGNMGATFMTNGLEASSHEWQRLRPGRYMIGVEAWDSQGQLLYPIASGPLALDSGQHDFIAHLRPTGSLEGRITGSIVPGTLVVALSEGGDALLPLFPDGVNAAEVQPIDSEGRFRVDVAPTGDFILLVGTEETIKTGRPRCRFPVSILKGENNLLELVL